MSLYKEYITEQIKIGKLNNFNLIAVVKSVKGNLLILKRTDDNIRNFTYDIKGNDYMINYKFLFKVLNFLTRKFILNIFITRYYGINSFTPFFTN